MADKRFTFKNAWTCAAAISLAAVLMIGTSAAAVMAASSGDEETETAEAEASDSLYPPKEHADVDYADMEYTGVDGAEAEKLRFLSLWPMQLR